MERIYIGGGEMKFFKKEVEYLDWDEFIEHDRYYQALGGS